MNYSITIYSKLAKAGFWPIAPFDFQRSAQVT
jgi:hypothetical protein